jgi:hypothetical protein
LVFAAIVVAWVMVVAGTVVETFTPLTVATSTVSATVVGAEYVTAGIVVV